MVKMIPMEVPEKRCLIFTRWSTANGGRNKATRLSVLIIFLALKVAHQII
jgi:hypothetical protein